MADHGTRVTDTRVRNLEKRLTDIYGEAQRDIEEKMMEFNRKRNIKDKIKLQELRNGKITQEQYNRWRAGQMFQGKQWVAKREQIEKVLYDSNTIAARLVNGERVNVFVANSNYQAYELEHTAGVNFGFNLYDSAAVADMIMNQPDVLPKWKIDQPKDYVWNGRKVNRQITLGIIEGENLEKIAKRLATNLSTQNMNKMRTFARTAMTEAQNSGRVTRLREAENMGIKVHKEWMATLDEVTRITHRELDGQKRPVDKPFEAGGYRIRYPGDPTAHPSMVYNCRCTLVGDLDDYPSEYDRYDNIEGKPIKNMTYREWENAKKGITAPKPQVPDNRQKHIDAILNSPTVAQLSQKQIDEFKTILGGMSEKNLELYEAMTQFHANNLYHDKGAWYQPMRRRVEMNIDGDGWEKSIGRKDSTAAWKTKFHEELHQLDHILGITQGYGRYSAITQCEGDMWGKPTEIGKKLREAIVGDVLEVINMSIDYVNDENPTKRIKHVTDINKPISRDVKDAFFTYMDVMTGSEESRALISPFTDAVGLVTKGRIDPYSKGYWGHNTKYQKDRGVNGATSECFAEIGSHIMREDNESLRVIEELMPRSVQAHREVLDEIASYVKSNRIHY